MRLILTNFFSHQHCVHHVTLYYTNEFMQYTIMKEFRYALLTDLRTKSSF